MTEAEAEPAATAPDQDGDTKPGAGNGARRTAIIGAATGIGSAALIAALLYANRGRGSRAGNASEGVSPRSSS